MEFIQQLIANETAPILIIFLIGIVNAVSHCLLASNIAAICYITQNVTDQKKIFLNGIFYTLGRTVTYTLLALIVVSVLKEGANIDTIEHIITHYGEKIIGPLMIIIGVILFFSHKLNFGNIGVNLNKQLEKQRQGSYWGSFIIGLVLAMAFCPTSAFLFFGIMVPMATSTGNSVTFPIVFSVASGLPVILIAWALAFSYERINKYYEKMQASGDWFRVIVSVVFVLIGLYFTFFHSHGCEH